jgi:hypothetical protein
VRKRVVLIYPPGRREHSDARRQQALDHAATLIADKRQENGPGDPDLFDWKTEFQYAREKLALSKRPGDMLVVATAKALRLQRPAGISRRMAHYWRNRDGFWAAVQWIGHLAYDQSRGDFIQPSRPRSSGALARSQTMQRHHARRRARGSY